MIFLRFYLYKYLSHWNDPILQSGSPSFCNDFWCYISRCPTDGVKRSINYGGQTKISQFQRLASILVFINLNKHIYKLVFSVCCSNRGSNLFLMVTEDAILGGWKTKGTREHDQGTVLLTTQEDMAICGAIKKKTEGPLFNILKN